MSERELQSAVIEMAKLLGWRVMHTRPARMLDGRWRTPLQGHEGFPDLVLLGRRGCSSCELKSEKGKLTQEQALWLNGFRASGPAIETYEWKPKHWESGEIEEVLR